jgi:hypothetical protein
MSDSAIQEYKKEMDYCKANGYKIQTLEDWLQQRQKLAELAEQIKQKSESEI